MYCRYCGKKISDKAKFCAYCGKQTMQPVVQNNASVVGQTALTTENKNKTSVGWVFASIGIGIASFVAFMILLAI